MLFIAQIDKKNIYNPVAIVPFRDLFQKMCDHLRTITFHDIYRTVHGLHTIEFSRVYTPKKRLEYRKVQCRNIS